MKSPVAPEAMEILMDFAKKSGATEARSLAASEILAEQRLADYCKSPKCPNYGLSAGCPPFVKGPDQFREFQSMSDQGLVFVIQAPIEIMRSNERRSIFGILHEISALVEGKAKALGFEHSMGFAGGCCKNLFCEAQLDCNVVARNGACGNPDKARASMSGYGVNVAKLCEFAGLTSNWDDTAKKLAKEGYAWAVGLVLIG